MHIEVCEFDLSVDATELTYDYKSAVTFNLIVTNAANSPTSCIYDDTTLEFYSLDFTNAGHTVLYGAEQRWTIDVLDTMDYDPTTTPHTIEVYAKFRQSYE